MRLSVRGYVCEVNGLGVIRKQSRQELQRGEGAL